MIEETKIVRGIPVLICRDEEDRQKKPLILLSHGFTGSKKDMTVCLKELAVKGYYAVAMDNRLHGDRPGPGFRSLVNKSSGRIDLFLLRKAMKETADDVKLLIDEFSVLEEVDENRIAMIGVSMGGFVTYRSILVDKRIKAGIPIIASPFWDDIPGDVPVLMEDERMDELRKLSGRYQPASHSEGFYPTALFMQAGDIDRHYNLNKIQDFYEDLKKQYFDCPEKLRLVIYPNTAHEFKREMWEQALQWLKNI